ncbi:phosphorylated adaptor for RNA export isoform X1 [Haemaphysalis longicornis]
MDTSVENPVTAYRTDRAYSTSEDDSDDEDKCWKRQATEKAKAMATSAGYDFAKSSAVAGEPPLPRKRKVNNVWGAVVSEELLTEDLGQVSVAPTESWAQDRQCESYDYMRRELDTRPNTGEPDIPVDDEESVTTHDALDVLGTAPRGAKRSFADRLGERACTRPSRSRRPVGRGGARSRRNESGSSKSGSSEREEDTAAEMVADMARRLQEPKVELLERAVTILGIPQCRKFLGMAEDIEASGGLMTLDKSRRRTPGGVFFYLLRVHVPRRQMQLIFAEEMQERERIRKRFRREQIRKNREKHVALAAAAKPVDYPRTSYSPTPLDGGSSELDYSPTRVDYSPTPLDGGSEPMADQEPGPSGSEPVVAADQVAAEESDEDCQIVYIDPMGADDDEEEGEVSD